MGCGARQDPTSTLSSWKWNSAGWCNLCTLSFTIKSCWCRRQRALFVTISFYWPFTLWVDVFLWGYFAVKINRFVWHNEITDFRVGRPYILTHLVLLDQTEFQKTAIDLPKFSMKACKGRVFLYFPHHYLLWGSVSVRMLQTGINTVVPVHKYLPRHTNKRWSELGEGRHEE